MSNRLTEFLSPPPTEEAMPQGSPASLGAKDFRQVAAPVRRFIVKNPAAALAAAFLAGVALAWWIKRR